MVISCREMTTPSQSKIWLMLCSLMINAYRTGQSSCDELKLLAWAFVSCDDREARITK